MDSLKNTLNGLIRANWRVAFDALADVASNPNIGADGAYSNSTYFVDAPNGIHPNTTAAVAIEAPIISAAINRAAAGSTHLPEIPYSSLPGCGTDNAGEKWSISDSSANTWGATVAAGGTNHVEVRCNGSAWTVMGK